MASVQHFGGSIAVVGRDVDSLVSRYPHELRIDSESPSLPFHITLITKGELQELRARRVDVDEGIANVDTRNITAIGIGGNQNRSVYFVVVVWNAGQQVRRALGLGIKSFHITLSKHDDHTISKGLSSLYTPISLHEFSVDDLDQIVFALNTEGARPRAFSVANYMAEHIPSSEKGFLRCADFWFQDGHFKLAMLAYGKVLHFDFITYKVYTYCLERIQKCARHTEWGSLFVPEEKELVPTELTTTLLTPWSPLVKKAITDGCDGFIPSYSLESRVRLLVPARNSSFAEMPRFFRWIVPFHFALMSTPRNQEDIDLLSSPHIGIRHILTLTEETPLPKEWFASRPGSPPSPSHTFIPIPNFHAPSVEQMDIILRLFEDKNNLPLLVHCGGGKGRAGTVAACYIAAYGFTRGDSSSETSVMAAGDAIAALRSIRPGSIETQHQEKFVHSWCSAVWKRNAILPPLATEPPPSGAEVIGQVDFNSTDLLVLVGLPGSGKSYFSKSLMARNSRAPWRRISQDDSGSRSACEREIGIRSNTKVILDRCNPSSHDRQAWLALAQTWAHSPVCVWFDYDADLCTSRAQNRLNHPTLPPGGRVRAAISSMKSAFVTPSLGEGFSGIVIIRSFEAAMSLVRKLSPPVDLFKFPRTAHLVDLGSIGEDDLVTQVNSFRTVTQLNSISNPLADETVVITEKVDGANIGISLDSIRAFRVQNRSHYITPASHAQFATLGSWLAKPHVADALQAILGADPFFHERYILFGEWMYATHSITYTALPEPFMAFDLYDRAKERWASRDVLERIVEARGIGLTPVIWRGAAADAPLEEKALKDMVGRRSLFWDGRVEGVYVKVERGGQVVQRGKVVRHDFIVGNDHWAKGIIRWNRFLRNDQ